MATKAEIRNRAANELGVLRLGQSLQSQDVTRIESAYDELYEELKEDGLATWPSTGSVPSKLVNYVAFLVALRCSTTYGISENRQARIEKVTGVDGQKALREIRKFITPKYTSRENARDY